MGHWEGNSPQMAGVVITLTILGFIALPLRVYVRHSNRALGVDDWLMMVGALPYLGLAIVCLGGSFVGVGMHAAALSESQARDALKWFWLFEIFWCMSGIAVKVSIALMLARIAGVKRFYATSLYIVSGLVTITSLISMFWVIFRCTPISYAWDTRTPNGHCQAAYMLADNYYATTAVNIATDWFCAMLPVPLLWNLQLELRTKISVGILLGLGVLASLSACVRFKYTVALVNSNDYLYSLGNLVLWGYTEIGIGFFVGSLGTLRPLMARFVQRVGAWGRNGKSEEEYDITTLTKEPTATIRNVEASSSSDRTLDESQMDLTNTNSYASQVSRHALP